MAKIGRNEKCPCRSGRKYKHCCALKAKAAPAAVSPEQEFKLTLMSGVERIQNDAAARKEVCRELGVFFFYATEKGNGWLLEMTDCDAVQVAKDGKPLDAPIDENSDTIEINWSHMYTIKEKQLELIDYKDKSIQLLGAAPTRELNAAMRRIRKKFSKEELDKVHIDSPDSL